MSRRVFCIGSLHHQRQVVAGWHPTGQHFSVAISAPGGNWSTYLYDADTRAEERACFTSGVNLHEVKAQLDARGIEAPEGFLVGLLADAQENI